MTLQRTTDAALIEKRLNAELRNVNRKIIGGGAIEMGLRAGDVFLVDAADTGRADGRGAICWLTSDRGWVNPPYTVAFQIWGPSRHPDSRERHLDILIDLCQWGIEHAGDFSFPFADRPMRYARDGHLMTVLADQFGSTTLIDGGRFGQATMRSGRASLGAERVRRGGAP